MKSTISQTQLLEPSNCVFPPVPAVAPCGDLISKVDSSSGRFYSIPSTSEKIFYPSVTTILKTYFQSYLARWRGELGNQEADRLFIEAGEKGTLVHELFSDLVNGLTLHYKTTYDNSIPNKIIHDDYIFVQLYKLQQFFEIVKPKIILNEAMLYSNKYKYAGTLDLLLKVEGGTFLINGRNPVTIKSGIYLADIKTANNIFPNYHWQTAAYAKATIERKLVRSITGTMILHTKSKVKNGIEGFSCIVRDKKQMQEDFKNFLKVKSIYDIDAPQEPAVYQFPNSLNITRS